MAVVFLLAGIEATQHAGVRSYLENVGFPLAVVSVVVGIRSAKGMKADRDRKQE